MALDVQDAKMIAGVLDKSHPVAKLKLRCLYIFKPWLLRKHTRVRFDFQLLFLHKT